MVYTAKDNGILKIKFILKDFHFKNIKSHKFYYGHLQKTKVCIVLLGVHCMGTLDWIELCLNIFHTNSQMYMLLEIA